jgi:acyl-CoA ligase (AMP-forming) (exosortase A-associated)
VHILRDCNVRILIASAEMFPQIRSVLSKCADLRLVVGVGPEELPDHQGDRFSVVPWGALLDHGPGTGWHRTIDADMAAIFYTSGSTGNPKGVVLSHQNMVAGATSVVRYLDNRSTDRLLAVLPLSFDYGFSQLSTGFLAGATVVLMDYLFPKDVIEVAERHQVTGLAGVPPLWIQIAKRSWPDSVVRNLRYVTNSGGAMPRVTLDLLRAKLPETRVFLMYGLTEAFRSTFLSPDELDRRPDSIGKAIPNAEILVVREDGSRCAPGEPGELVHRGALVALGYWNDAEKTARRFRPVPDPENGLVIPELAVWSGDTVTEDQDGFLYFVGRRDDMIKTSGYRVSPTEVETAVYAVEIVAEAIAVGVPHSLLGQGIVVVVVKTHDHQGDDEMNTEMILAECRRRFGRPGTQTAG